MQDLNMNDHFNEEVTVLEDVSFDTCIVKKAIELNSQPTFVHCHRETLCAQHSVFFDLHYQVTKLQLTKRYTEC